jgi:hypothetical protein
MAVTKMMALISGGLSTIIDGRSRSLYRVNRERNGLHAPNTSHQNREGATGTSSQDQSAPSPSIFVIKPISIFVTTLSESVYGKGGDKHAIFIGSGGSSD